MNPINDFTFSNCTTSFITINNREIPARSTVVSMRLPTTALFPRVSTLRKFDRIGNQSNSCMECKHKFTYSDKMELGNRQTVGLCVGCFRLHDQATDDEELMDMRRWLLNGDLPRAAFFNKSDFESEMSSNNWMERLHFRMSSIEKRLRELREKSTKRTNVRGQYLMMDLPTINELSHLYVTAQNKCVLTGRDVCWQYPFSPPMYWAISFDHVIPLSKARLYNIANPWHISNMQIVLHLMNQIKGNARDKEVRRWLDEWRCGQLHGYRNCNH